MSAAVAGGAAGTPPTAAHPVVLHKGLITVSIMLATIMQVLDTTIANVALPSMQGSLGAAQDQINWVLTSYIVAAAICTPVTGWLSDRMGCASSSSPRSRASSSPRCSAAWRRASSRW